MNEYAFLEISSGLGLPRLQLDEDIHSSPVSYIFLQGRNEIS